MNTSESIGIVLYLTAPPEILGMNPLHEFRGLATAILEEAVRLAFAVDSVTAEQVLIGGPLNDCFLIAHVADVNAALRSLQKLMERLQLWNWSTVYRADSDEGYMRPIHCADNAAPGQPFDFNLLLARVGKEKIYAETLNRLAAYIRRKNPPPNPPETPQP